MTSLRVAILTVSDRSARGERPDSSGPLLERFITEQGWQVTKMAIVPDEEKAIRQVLLQWCEEDSADLILTTGGTGVSPRDVTPEATQKIIERPLPGIPEAIRAASLKITPHAMLSRATAGIRKRTLIINLPGSPKGALESLQIVLPALPHAIALLRESPEAEKTHSSSYQKH
ncbi:MAG: MogA/MoaB family molybdenum cofactor biosynthesis protein [Thermanaerothrix sp.]|nr:MogA/MoaB family molybdenum cofactor biosynthesis protein [Thermanaerothrix sp.]